MIRGVYEVISYKILPLFHKQTEHNLEGKDRSVEHLAGVPTEDLVQADL